MTIQEKIDLVEKFKKDNIDLTELYMLREILWSYEGDNTKTINEILKYSMNLWLNSETKADSSNIAYAVVNRWEEIKDNLDDRDIQLDILCEVEEW